MSQKAIEVILTRQLASYLATPIFIVDPQGTLLYYNEPAEKILGQPFEETGEMPASVWSTVFTPTNARGKALSPEALPLMVALAERRPAHGRFWIRGMDGVRRHIEGVAVPIIGQAERFLGGMALCWEVGEESFAATGIEEEFTAIPPKVIEIILARQLASYLAMPITIYDLQGTLIFYNEPAEPILGKRFDETGEILVVDLPHIFYPTDEEGTPLPTDVLAAGIALFERRPAYHRVWIRGLDGVRRHLEVTAFPIIGQADRFLGIIVLLWEISA